MVSPSPGAAFPELLAVGSAPWPRRGRALGAGGVVGRGEGDRESPVALMMPPLAFLSFGLDTEVGGEPPRRGPTCALGL